MLIVLALIFAAVVGVALHFAIPHRPERGAALAPMIAAAAAAAVYTALTWGGLAEDNLWLWVISLGAPVLVTWALVAVLSSRRARHDARTRVRLGIA